jgi:hypothetical protein
MHITVVAGAADPNDAKVKLAEVEAKSGEFILHTAALRVWIACIQV